MVPRLVPHVFAVLACLALPARPGAAATPARSDSVAAAWLHEAGRLAPERRYAELDSLAALAQERLATVAGVDSNLLARALYLRAYSRVQRVQHADPATSAFFAGAERLYERMARPDTLSWISTLDTHAWLFVSRAQPYSADRLLVRARALCRAPIAGADSMLSGVWYTSAFVYRRLEKYDLAIATLDSCRELRTRLHGPGHPRVAEPLVVLGGVYLRTGRLEDAAGVLESAIAALERGGAAAINRLPGALAELATAQFRLGDIAGSIEAIERQIAVYVRRDGPDTPFLVPPLYSIGLRLFEFGDHAGARAVFADALRRAEAAFGPGNPHAETARAMASVTALLSGDTAAAARDLERAREYLLARPLDPTRMANQIEAFRSMLCLRRGDPAGAVRTVAEGLARERATPTPNPLVMGILLDQMASARMAAFDTLGMDSTIAELSALFGDPGRIERKLYGDALRIRARAELWRGRRDLATRLAFECEQAERERLLQNVRALPDQRALQLAQELGDGLALVVHLSEGAGDSLVEAAWDRVVRWRGLVTAELAQRRAPHAAAFDTALAGAHARWAAASRRVARLEVSDSETPERLAAARAATEAAERQFAAVAAARGVARDTAPATLAAVRARLGADQALVSIVRFAPRDLPAGYAAFVTKGPAGRLHRIDLGSSAALSEWLGPWRAALATPPPSGRERSRERECRRLGAEVRARTWGRWAAAIAGARSVVLVADGELADLPWHALPEGERGYLVESGIEIRTPGAERELLRSPTRDGAGLLALGDPDFGRAVAAVDPPAGEVQGRASAPGVRAGALATALLPRNLGAGCDEPPTLSLGSLPGARAEVEDIARAWSAAHPGEPVTSLLGPEGTERAFKADAHGRAVLHLATHGIVWGDSCAPVYEGTRGVGGVGPLPSGTAKAPPRAADAARRPGAPARPAATSGPSPWSGRRVWLALAGANHARAGAADENDGLLTADEVVTLDLTDADWVVLSACQSGIGAHWPLEGSSGMRRAFRLAGARTVIASQWAIADESTREWMRALYAARTSPEVSAARAMTAASRAVLEARRRAGRDTHPFYWAAFTASGE